MNKNPEENAAKRGQGKTEKTASIKSGQSESDKKKQGAKTEKKESFVDEIFGKLSKVDLSKINTGAVISGVDNLYKEGKKLDLKVTNYAGDLCGKLTQYINNSLGAYKNKK